MKKIAIIGAGISGLTMANLLKEKNTVVVFEADSKPGGLIKCDVVNGSLYHKIGGHVFNTKRQDVLDWFWNIFEKENEFTKAIRNATVSMPDEKMIPYPIENHMYLFDEYVQKAFVKDLVDIAKINENDPKNFEEFLRGRFGDTLYNLYFKPYNYKIWRKDLAKVPLTWLEGKLPMPTVEEMIYNNINHVEENSFVHSSFYYAKKGGSQFLVDKISEDLDIRVNSPINEIKKQDDKWIIYDEIFDMVVFCGNIKKLTSIFNKHIDIESFEQKITDLDSHGTTSVFCEIKPNPYSWIYMPSIDYEAHRIICTGNFAKSNNAEGMMTGSIEFTDFISKDDILNNLKRIPFEPKYLAHHYEKYTYPIQNNDTRGFIKDLKLKLDESNVFLLGRFAEWEYYNMDAAIGAAIDLSKQLKFDNKI